MKNERLVYWTAQIVGWLGYCTLVLLTTLGEKEFTFDSKAILTITILFGAGLLISHLMRTYMIRKNWLQLKFEKLLPRVLLISLLSSASLIVITFVIPQLINNFNWDKFNMIKAFNQIAAGFVLFILWNSIYFTYHFFKKSLNQEIQNLNLAASQRELEIKTLRSQLNPHFLFNSLNGIRALIEIEPEKAKVAVSTLSNLLRSTLHISTHSLVPLRTEIEIIESYLDLEKLRFEERLQVEMEIDESILDYEIPPFLIQTLVENAVKHGIGKLIAGGKLRILARTTPTHQIEIIITNDGKIETKDQKGIGMLNTRQRLNLHFPNNSKFDFYEENNQVICKINITPN